MEINLLMVTSAVTKQKIMQKDLKKWHNKKQGLRWLVLHFISQNVSLVERVKTAVALE